MRDSIDGLGKSADIRHVYGDPIETHGKTLVPVGRVAWGVGGGFGTSDQPDEEASEGAGGGAAMLARPIGVIEVTTDETRFVRFSDSKRLLLAAAIGFLLGRLLGR